MSQPNSWEPLDPMQQGQVTPAPEHDAVYPAGDPVITPEPTENGAYPVDHDGYTDLSSRKPRPKFRIASQVYEGKAEVAAGVMMRYSAQAVQRQKMLEGSGDDPDVELQETVKMFRLLLRKESADRLIGHLHMIPSSATEEDEIRIADEADADEDTVGLETFMNLLPWLMEQYGMAPTEPSSNAPAGSSNSPDGGNDSTANTQAEVSISGTSPSTSS